MQKLTFFADQIVQVQGNNIRQIFFVAVLLQHLAVMSYSLELRGCLKNRKFQNFRGLAPFVIALEPAKIGNFCLTTQNTVQNFEFFSFWRGKLHLDRSNMYTSQSFSNNL